MIAEALSTATSAVSLPVHESSVGVEESAAALSLDRVVASMQLLLAVRREARSRDHAYWYTIARGL